MKFLFTILFLGTCLCSHAQSPWLVKDINTNSPVNLLSDGTFIGGDGCDFKYPDQTPLKMYKVKSFALFFADDGRGKKGLWRSDGTKDGTYFLSTITDDTSKKIWVLNAYSDSNLLYFEVPISDQNGSLFAGLWRSDGTVAGTYKIFAGFDKKIDETFSIAPAPEYKIAGANIGNEFYFIGGEQGGDTVYTNLYKTDGTAAGTKVYFQMYKVKANIADPFTTDQGHVIGFNNHIYFEYFTQDKGREIWYGDGINPPVLSCDFSPGTLSTQLSEWVNLNDKYLMINGSIEVSPNTFQYKIIRIKSTDPCPVILDDDISSNASLPVEFYLSLNNEYALTGNNFFFYKTNKAGNFVVEGTNGEIAGTYSIFLNDGSSPTINGVCTKGAILSSGFSLIKTYIWDGNSANSYHIFPLISDSLNKGSAFNSIFKVVQFDSTLMVFTIHGTVWQSDVNSSYCYRVASSTNSEGEGVKIGDSAYLNFGSVGEGVLFWRI